MYLIKLIWKMLQMLRIFAIVLLIVPGVVIVTAFAVLMVVVVNFVTAIIWSVMVLKWVAVNWLRHPKAPKGNVGQRVALPTSATAEETATAVELGGMKLPEFALVLLAAQQGSWFGSTGISMAQRREREKKRKRRREGRRGNNKYIRLNKPYIDAPMVFPTTTTTI